MQVNFGTPRTQPARSTDHDHDRGRGLEWRTVADTVGDRIGDGILTSTPAGTLCLCGRGTLLAALLLLGCDTHPAKADPGPRASAAPAAAASSAFHAATKSPASAASATGPSCREQTAQAFLLRRGQIAKPHASPAERREILAARKRSIDYRTREYGRFPGFGSPGDNPHPPRYYAERTTFMGLDVVLNRRIVPALHCVEAALERDCAAHPYQPRHLSGMRFSNTYKDYEISNHVYGIAIDIDPELNPCCDCVGRWSQKKICRKKVDSPFDRMAMPRCWVKVFERYGFHWLGHDELHDTMHFEFLGDPDRILE
jgi:hypothetical protein